MSLLAVARGASRLLLARPLPALRTLPALARPLAASASRSFVSAAARGRTLPQPASLWAPSPLARLVGGSDATPLALWTATRCRNSFAPRRSQKKQRKFKLKTHSGAGKRYKLRADGRFVHWQIGRNHLMAGSSRSRQTLKKRGSVVLKGNGMQKKLRKLMPYGDKYSSKRVRTPVVSPRGSGHKAETGRIGDPYYTAKAEAVQQQHVG